MLVLSRKREERILLGDEIEIKVVAIHGNRVRLGVTCPDHVRVLRSEIFQAGDSASPPERALEIITP